MLSCILRLRRYCLHLRDRLSGRSCELWLPSLISFLARRSFAGIMVKRPVFSIVHCSPQPYVGGGDGINMKVRYLSYVLLIGILVSVGGRRNITCLRTTDRSLRRRAIEIIPQGSPNGLFEKKCDALQRKPAYY